MDLKSNINMHFFRIENLQEPIFNDHAATKGYVDSEIVKISEKINHYNKLLEKIYKKISN